MNPLAWKSGIKIARRMGWVNQLEISQWKGGGGDGKCKADPHLERERSDGGRRQSPPYKIYVTCRLLFQNLPQTF